jgi:isopropylmalate/homocitrate/citramalate synthase
VQNRARNKSEKLLTLLSGDTSLTSQAYISKFAFEKCATCNATPRQAYVGNCAFAHKGGLHVAGLCTLIQGDP